MLRLICIATALVLYLTQTCQAILKLDDKIFDTSLFSAPEVQNEALEQKVNLAFKDTPISTILLTLSKTADFNVVFPDKYDKAITITLKNQKIIDAISDICKLNNLHYNFKSNSLIVSGDNVNDVLFESIPVLYRDAKEIAASLNDVLFAQLTAIQNPNAPQAAATADPGKNSVIITANQEQIKAAKNYIKELDTVPKVKLFAPNFLSYRDIKKLEKAFTSKNNDLHIKRLEKNLILLKGDGDELQSFYELLQSKDHKPEATNLVVEFYGFKEDDPLIISDTNQLIKANQTTKIDRQSFNGLGLLTVFEKLESIDLQLNFAEEANVRGVNLSGHKTLIDPEQYTLSVFDTNFSNVNDQEVIVQLLDEKELAKYKDLKKMTNKPAYMLMTLKAGLAPNRP